MTYQPAAISGDLNNLPKLPSWVTSGGAETLETVAFRSGAALTVLDQLVSDPTHGVPVKLLANRLALSAATATSKLEGRLAGQADIRDAYHLAPPGEARGPDGDLLAFWREAVCMRQSGAGEIADLVGADFAGEVGVWLDAGLERARTHGPLAGCVAALRAVLETDDRAERGACLLSDIVLAQAMNWKAVLPVSAQRLTKTVLRDLTAEPQGAKLAIQTRILESIEATVRLARDLARRAEALRTVGPKLRAKGSEAAVADDRRDRHPDDGSRRAAILRPAGGTGCGARADRAIDLPALWGCAMTRTAMTSVAKRKNSKPNEAGREGGFDRELADLPQDLRRREWMGRIEAVLFASATPVGRDDLARVVGQGASVEMLIEDIQTELVGRPYELVETAGGWMFRTKTQFADAIKAAADLGDQTLAFARQDNVYCVTVFDGVAYQMLDLFSLAFSCPGFFKDIGDTSLEDVERVKNRSKLAGYGLFRKSVDEQLFVKTDLAYPLCPTRELAALYFSGMALDAIWMHELAHAFMGHVDYASEKLGIRALNETPQAGEDLRQMPLEAEADRFAAATLVQSAFFHQSHPTHATRNSCAEQMYLLTRCGSIQR